ncbi:PREDICTED: gem-associated protein 8-like isoform X1 [Diuraphis noxia]|uniref:gem-associated protein 8-like isoform X1 n=1 Tax=Diuraphis noxia TaxID=143948 RepID=UPI000763A995|nr:PREDICTED: gem-associated protein 8-like isoform X1 [Diuraphis noxia]
MDQNLLNFWKNYEDIINWGYRISGTRGSNNSNNSSAAFHIETKEISGYTTLNTEENEYDADVYSSDESVDIDLEYLKFCKTTFEHQEKIELEKRKVDKEYGLCNSPSFENETTSNTEINDINPMELYGSKVNEIECLENELHSEFDKFCSMKKPVLWPGMAFNWDVPAAWQEIKI